MLAVATIAAVAPTAALHSARAADAPERPNIVLIMADDMGFSDLGCYGGEIETPTLNRLAEGGLRFTQFYNTGRCCPTRASLLTGLYPHQAGVGWMMTDRGYDGYRGDLNRRCVTIAEALGNAGYATYMTGKWHVTKATHPDGPKHNWPRQRGFDRFYGTITGAGSFFDPGTLTRDNTMISPLVDPEYQPEQYYYTDAISDHAVRFIQEHAEEGTEQPFFLYVAYTAAHWPMHALEKDIAKYRGRYDEGYAAVRGKRLERLRRMGLIQPDWKLSPREGDWDEVQHKEWEARCMEVYAAMVDNMDQGIGRIVKSLEQQGQLDNTLILFLQDNGGCQEGVGRNGSGKRPARATLPEIAQDAIRLDVIPKQNRAGVPTLQGPGVMPGPEDTYIAYGINWANVSNTPFREYKHFVHEGGISTPLIAHWPRSIERRGELEHQPGHLIDVMATCLDVAKAEYPRQFADHEIRPPEGVSLVPAFAGRSLERPRPIFWEHEGNRAVRDGRWKLVAKENQPWELYDMRSDRTEMHDLAQEQPERVERMAALWQAWAERADVLPLGAWRGQRNAQFNRKQKRFELAAGASLTRDAAPYVVDRPLRITVDVKRMADQGVLVAQGGSADGYSFYVLDGQLCFAVRNQGNLSLLLASTPRLASAKQLAVQLRKDGTAILEADGKRLYERKLSGLLQRMPIDGLEVGRDENGAVSSHYEAPFPFRGEIERVVIGLDP